MCVYTQAEKKNAKYIKCALGSPCEKLSGSCRTKKNTNHIQVQGIYVYLHTHMHTFDSRPWKHCKVFNYCVKTCAQQNLLHGQKNNLDPSDLILIISTDYLTLMHLPSLREEPCSSKGILNG